ncbi:MAG TPA: lipid-A-disaccharide synthase [Chitinophagaceae bacterium]|jgi:lipid-A-disaccharide synthase|nr:lipid-A-disaccharide synthase [Chitinophagaceae bacterium]
MKYYIIAGEASGDLHGSNLITALKKNDAAADIRCWGGDKMQEAGGTLVKHYRELAFMGFAEVLMNLRTIFRNLRFCKEDILQYRPDAIILIDYPGFNLRIAKWAKQQGLRIIYYISPQVWAWKEGRVKMMKRCIDKMLVILPFEKDYYKNKWDWEVEYVGHPLIEVIESRKSEDRSLKFSGKPIVALLPGSRKQEILKKLPIMLEVSKSFQEYQFIVAKAPGLDEDFYNELLKPYSNVSFVSNKTYDLLLQSKAALVTSGTATLETALFEVPEVVCYKGSWLSYQIGRRLVKVKYISLVNLIMDKLVVKELIQDQLTVENLKKELEALLNDPSKKEQLQKDYEQLRQLLNTGGNASAKAALSITQFLSSAI